MALRMRNVPAVFEWNDVSSTPRSPLYLAGPEPLSVQLSLSFDEEQQAVSLKIRVLLYLEGEAVDKTGSEFFYGLIHPSNVALLCHDPAHHLPDSASPVLHGPTTTCLRLVLRSPVPIVIPSDVALPLRVKGTSQQLFGSLEMLAKQTVLAVHVDQHNISSATALQRLCEAFSMGTIKQHPRHDILRGFYSGRGGTILDGQAFASGNTNEGVRHDGPHSDQSTSMPPPYANNQQEPPPQLFAHTHKKRKWAHADVQTTTLSDLEPMTRHKLQTEALLALLGGIEDQITKRIRSCLSEEMDKIRREKAQEWEEVIKPHIEQEVEDSVVRNLAHEKEEFKDEVKDEVKEELKDELQSGMVSITFPSS